MIIAETHQVFKLLGERTRLRIMVLLTEGEMCICNLMACLGLPQSTVSRHMATMRLAGLVKNRREGKWIHYGLASPDSSLIDGVIRLLESLKDQSPHRDDLLRFRRLTSSKTCGNGET